LIVRGKEWNVSGGEMMAKQKIEEIVTAMVQPFLGEHGFELVDVEFKKEGTEWYLRVFIDKPGGIEIDDCQMVSEWLSDRLDEVDPIPQSYYLEVSSPGIERPLKKDHDYEVFKGRKILVHTFAPLHGGKEHTGELLGLVDNTVQLKLANGEMLAIPREQVAVARLVAEF